MNKILAIVVGLLVLGGVGYYFLNGKEVDESSIVSNEQTVATSTNTTTGTQATSTPASDVKTVSIAEVKLHVDATSCYTVIRGNVYDLTSWIDKHPGGRAAILFLCGKDGTNSFVTKHGGKEPMESKLASFKIGALAQ
jgi:cytochrome b involved in lipid metabolism